MSVSIDSIELNIKQSVSKTDGKVEGLIKSLQGLNRVLNQVSFDGAKNITKAFGKVNSAIDVLTSTGTQKTNNLTNALDKLYKVTRSMSGLTKVAKQLNAVQNIPNPMQDVRPVSGKSLWKSSTGMDIGFESGVPEMGTNIHPVAEEFEDATSKAKTFFKTIKEGFKTFSNSSKEAFKNFAERGEQFNKAIHKSTHAHNKFLASIKRVVFYRILRSAIRMITQSVSEGVKNLIQYSNAINDTDSAMAHSTTTQYATQFLYLKNTIGATIAPLLQELLPVVQQVTAWFVAGANAVNQFISALQGKTVYTRAKEYTQDTAENLESATGSAKALKKELLGLDELNVLSTDQGGGGGAKVNTPDYSQMFEEVPIEENILELAKQFDDIWDIVGKIGLAILGWQLSKTFVGQLIDNFGKNSAIMGALGALGRLLAGGALMAIGLKFSWEGGEDLASGNTLVGGLETLGGSIISAIGGALIASSLGFSILSGGAIGLVLSLAVTGLAFTVKKAKQYQQDLLNSPEMKVIKEGIEKAEEYLETAREIKVKVSEITWEISPEKQGKLDLAKDLIKQIYEIDAKDILSDEDIKTIKGKIEQLNGLGLGTLISGFDDLTGHVKDSKSAVIELYEQIKKEYQLEALRDAYIEAYKQQALAETNLTNALENQKNVKEEYKKLADARDEAWSQFAASMGLDPKHINVADLILTPPDEMTSTQWDLYSKAIEASNTAGIAREALQEANDTVSGSLEAVGEATKKIKQLNKQEERLLDNTNTIVETFHDYFEPETDSQKEAFDRLKKAVKNTTKAMDLWNKLQLQDKDAMVEIKIALKKDAQSDQEVLDRVTYSVGNSKLPIKATLQEKADGGMVDGGHLFFANENGNPEYIGSINGKTAVANSDQMAQAIENASFRGMARALSENGGNKDTVVIIEPNASGLFKVTQKEARDYYNRTGKLAFAN